jgi:hypothetical protein
MTQQIIDVGAAANDGTGEPLRDAFNAVNDNFTQIWTAGPVGSQVQITGNIVTTTVTNLGLTLAGNGIGNIQANSSIVPGTPGVYNLGDTNNPFQYVYGGYFVGNGSLLTGVAVSGGNIISNGNSNVKVLANSNVTVSVSGVSNVATFTPNGILLDGNIIPVSGNSYSLGNSTNQWSDLYVSNASIYLNNVPLSLNASNVLTINGQEILSNNSNVPIVTTANITAGYFFGNGSQLTGINVSSSNLTNGNSNVQVYANSDIAFSSNGVSNVMVVSSQDVTITGNLTVTGNATLTGNILGDRIQNGNTSIDIQTASGNANISVGGVSNVAVFSTNGLDVSGNLTADFFSGNGTGLTGVLADRGSDTNNWDTLTEMGVYLVNRASWSGTQGTPLDSQVFVGLLQVQTSQSQATTQIFYPGTVNLSDVKIQWNRNYWNNAWTPWIKMTNDGQLISGGEF